MNLPEPDRSILLEGPGSVSWKTGQAPAWRTEVRTNVATEHDFLLHWNT